MTIKKLNVGESATFHITNVKVSTTGKWPDYIFETASGESYSAPKAALDRQLQKLTLGVEQLAGNTFTLERAPNTEDASRSWWNLYIAAEGDTAPPKPSKRLPSPVPGDAPAAYAPQKVSTPTPAPVRAVAGLTGALPTPARTNVNATRASLDDVAAAYKWALNFAKAEQKDFGTPETISQCATHLNICLKEHGLVAGFAARDFDAAVRETFDLEQGGQMPQDDNLPF